MDYLRHTNNTLGMMFLIWEMYQEVEYLGYQFFSMPEKETQALTVNSTSSLLFWESWGNFMSIQKKLATNITGYLHKCVSYHYQPCHPTCTILIIQSTGSLPKKCWVFPQWFSIAYEFYIFFLIWPQGIT